jgi:hypothetical protein
MIYNAKEIINLIKFGRGFENKSKTYVNSFPQWVGKDDG